MQGSDCEGRLSERPVPEAGSAASSTRRADKRWRTVSGRLRYLPHRCSTLCGEFEEELVQDRTSLHGRAESRGPPSDFCSSRRHSLPVPRRSKTGRLSVQPSALRTILFTFILHLHFVHLSKKTYYIGLVERRFSVYVVTGLFGRSPSDRGDAGFRHSQLGHPVQGLDFQTNLDALILPGASLHKSPHQSLEPINGRFG